MALPQKNSPRIKTPYPYLNLVSNYLEKNILSNAAKINGIQSRIMDQNCCILFWGHPVYQCQLVPNLNEVCIVQWNLLIRRLDVTKPSYKKVILLLPAHFHPIITRNLIYQANFHGPKVLVIMRFHCIGEEKKGRF